MRKITYSGWLSIGGDIDDEEKYNVLFISCVDRPLAEELEFLKNKEVSVRYWISDKEISISDAIESFALKVMGLCYAKFDVNYSEATGFLWTDEFLKVGGHDLLKELKSYVGKYLIIEIEIN